MIFVRSVFKFTSIALCLVTTVHAKNVTIYLGADASTPAEQTAIIRVPGEREQVQKKTNPFSPTPQSFGTLFYGILVLDGQPKPHNLDWAKGNLTGRRSIGAAHVPPGRYLALVECAQFSRSVYMDVTVDAVAGEDYVLECVGTHQKTVQALVRPQERDQQAYQGGASELEASNVSGVWSMELNSNLDSRINELTIKQRANKLTGRLELRDRTVRISGNVNGNAVLLECNIINSGEKVRLEFVGQIDRNGMRGTMAFGDALPYQGNWSATRKPNEMAPTEN